MQSVTRVARAVAALAVIVTGGCATDPVFQPGAEYTGREVCMGCHPQQGAQWQGSHHDLAMQKASPESVKGDFSGSQFTYSGVTSTFYQKDGTYFVQTDAADGSLQEFEIAYTFGTTPLQQYLIRFPRGRLQALSICWDARPASRGGQRWFHLYPGEAVDHKDILHWTGPYQNWNHMCAECHSTNVRKGYLADSDSFNTTYSEINVACEACHGPGSNHVAWAEAQEPPEDPLKGLVFDLVGSSGQKWQIDSETGLPQRLSSQLSRNEIETCGPCHSRRATLSYDYRHGQPLAQTHALSLLRPELYYADGQIRDEVYVYGSFLQSRMYAQGVACSDCHNPHSLELKAPGNQVCTQCHLEQKFDVSEHHHHVVGNPGSNCVDCHMPSRNYMVIDPRRDHSFRVPRPDLSAQLDTPNPCSGCHPEQSPEWAAQQIQAWTGRRPGPHYGEALYAGAQGLPGAARLLQDLAGDPAQPPIVQATALQMLGDQIELPGSDSIRRGTASASPWVRRAAASASVRTPPEKRFALIGDLLHDPMLSVRLEAARVLAGIPRDGLSPPQNADLDRGLAEFRKAQQIHADRPESHLELGYLHLVQGRREAAEEEYRQAIRLAPGYGPAYVNLADLYRVMGREAEGEALLKQGIARVSESADLHFSLGLLLVRRRRHGEALAELEQAARLLPDNTHYAYVYAVALQSKGELDQAIKVLKSAYARRSHDPELLIGLASFSRLAGDLNQALEYAQRLATLYPELPAAQQLLSQIKAEANQNG